MKEVGVGVCSLYVMYINLESGTMDILLIDEIKHSIKDVPGFIGTYLGIQVRTGP